MEIELVILLVTVVLVLLLGYIVTYSFKGSVPETSVSDKQRDMLLRKFSTSERKKTNLSRLNEAHKTATNNGTLRKVSKGEKSLLQQYKDGLAELDDVAKIKHSGKTHIANYTKYRYTGSSSRDIEIYHQPTQQWVLYYLMFSTPFEDSSLKCNGVDVTGSCSSAETSSVSRSDVFASPEYDDSTTRNNHYSDDYSSSSDNSSSSYSSSDSGSSSSYSSSSD